MSKIFERQLQKQTTSYICINSNQNSYVAMVLKGYSTQAVLISMLKKWRQILDKKGCA